ncbi:MAG TPA: hypothetical protein VI431_13725, partial [Candidatus Acidoferrum sp.]
MFLVSGVPLGVMSYTTRAQDSPPKPVLKPQLKDDESDDPKIDSKAILEANQKDIKKNIERLFQLASELKADVEKTDSVQVLSVAMIKKAEEIEKLAKSIRSRAIG